MIIKEFIEIMHSERLENQNNFVLFFRVGSPKKKKAKPTDLAPRKVKTLTKELEDERARVTALMKALEKERTEKAALQASVVAFRTANGTADDSSVDLDGAPRSSSTRRVEPTVNFEESRFVSSVNQLSVSSMTIPECKPLDDDVELSRHSFEMWKDLLVDSMKLAGIEDEGTKFILFKIKAGPRLLGIYNTTKSAEDAPDPEMSPFSNALHRLKSYFGSGSDIMLQRRKLALMMQKPEESDLSFVNRVATIARLCEFSGGKELEEIIGTIAGQARNREVRTAALRMLNRGGSVSDLVDKVREIETIRINEEFYRQKNRSSEPAMIAPIRADYPRNQISRNRYQPYQGKGTSTSSRGPSSSSDSRYEQRSGRRYIRGSYIGRRGGNSSKLREEKCWRCGSAYHSPSECPAIDKTCRNCGRAGHFQRVCHHSSQSAPTDNHSPETTKMEVKKIAAVTIDKVESEQDPSEHVSDASEN